MMDRFWIGGLLAIGLAGGASDALAATPRDPSGTWLTQDGRARVRVEKCGAGRQNVCGYIVWLKPGSVKGTTDAKNPDPAKASRPVLGHQLILGLRPNQDGEYEGKIYNSEDGKSYDVTVWQDGADLKVKGCLIAFLCSTQTWTRTTDVAAGQLAGPTGAAGGPVPDAEWASAAPAAPPAKRDPRPKT